MPILGTIASSRATAVNLFEPIMSYTIPSNTGTFSLSSIPQTYQHLQLRYIGISSGDFLLKLQFNDDTGSGNYSRCGMWNNGGSGTVQSDTTANADNAGWFYTSTAGSSWTSSVVINILDYTNTNKFKTTIGLAGNNNNSTAGANSDAAIGGGVWRSTNAITKINMTMRSNTVNTGSFFALYGIKG